MTVSKVRNMVKNKNLALDLWTVDPRDWARPGANEIVRRVVLASKSGSNILLHVLYQQTVDALPDIITGIQKNGLTFE